MPHLPTRAAYARQQLCDHRASHRRYILEHGEDPPEIRDWQECFMTDGVAG
jgi:phosphoketolase